MADEPAFESAKPVVKWAGGKRQILSYLISVAPDKFGTYYEPFVGGGALLIELYNSGFLEKAIISDINEDLVDMYRIVKERPEELLHELSLLKFKNNREDYYKARDKYNSIKESNPEKTALFIYLNRHGYNGLYRVNSRGEFNVPFGRYSNPSLPGREEIYSLSKVLKVTEVLNEDFEESVKSAGKRDFVYFDPPYMPVSSSSYFTDYNSAGFSKENQIRLYETFKSLSKRGVFVMESNSDSDFIEELYNGFNIVRIKARRNINSVASKRGPIDELIIRNYGED